MIDSVVTDWEKKRKKRSLGYHYHDDHMCKWYKTRSLWLHRKLPVEYSDDIRQEKIGSGDNITTDAY